ncbi:MAG: hypothetical protein N3B18_06865 [Desulfobacterota bacterium]|nr:hypothetical protein [Thermodesulfobacteriota bacterium]
MSGRVTFLVIMPNTGRQIRFSLHKSIIYIVCIMSILLLASGMIGMVKYQENIHLKNQCKLLAAEKNKMEAIARTVQDIERESTAIKNMLGLDAAAKKTQPP